MTSQRSVAICNLSTKHSVAGTPDLRTNMSDPDFRSCRTAWPVILRSKGLSDRPLQSNSDEPRLLERGADEPGEQRMRLERAALEFGMKLDPDEPRVIGAFDDLG